MLSRDEFSKQYNQLKQSGYSSNDAVNKLSGNGSNTGTLSRDEFGKQYNQLKQSGYSSDEIVNMLLPSGSGSGQSNGGMNVYQTIGKANPTQPTEQEMAVKTKEASDTLKGERKQFWSDAAMMGTAGMIGQYSPEITQMGRDAWRRASQSKDKIAGAKTAYDDAKKKQEAAVRTNARRDELIQSLNNVGDMSLGPDYYLEQRKAALKELHEIDEQLGNAEHAYDASERIEKTVGGALKGYGGNITNAAGTAMDWLHENWDNEMYEGWENNPYADYSSLPKGGKPLVTQEDVAPLKYGADKLQGTADKLTQESMREIGIAKADLSALGQAGVDLSVNLVQMGADAAGRAIGLGMLPFFTRAAGGAAQEARQAGANVNQQLEYGVTKGLIEVGTEKLFDGVAGIFGKGAADDVVESVVRKLAKTNNGRTVLRALAGASGEGTEEVISDLLDPFAKLIYNDAALKEAWENRKDLASDMLYDYLIGFAMGGLGSGGSIITGQDAQKNAALRRQDIDSELSSEAFDVEQQNALDDIRGQTRARELDDLDYILGLATLEEVKASQAAKKITPPENGTAASTRNESVTVVENLKNNIPAMKEMTPVAETNSAIVSSTPGRTMVEKAKVLFEKIKGTVTRAGFGDVEINNRSVKDDTAHGIGAAKAAVIPAIPSVIQNGKQIDFQQNWKGRPYDGYVFAAPVNLDGKTVYVAAVVKQTSKNKFYLHEVVDSDGNIIKINDGEKVNQTSLAPVDDAGALSPSISTAPNGTAGEAVASPAISIPASGQNVNRENVGSSGASGDAGRVPPQLGDGGTNDEIIPTGAKQSQFWTNTLNTVEERANVPDEARTPLWYLPRSEAESLSLAAQRLNADEQGTINDLINTEAWSGVQVDAATAVYDQLYSAYMQSMDSEALNAYRAWRKVMQNHVTETARGIQALAKYTRPTGRKIVDDAVGRLEDSKIPESEQTHIIDEVAQYAEEYDKIAENDTEGLKNLIIRLAERRRTDTLIKGNLEKSLNRRSNAWMREAAYRQIEALISDRLNAGKQNVANKVASSRVLAMLSGLPTIGRNIEGNYGFGAVDMLVGKFAGARALDALLSKATGKRTVVGGRDSLKAEHSEWYRNAAAAFDQSMLEIALDIDMSDRSRPYGMPASNAFTADSNKVERLFHRWSQLLSYGLTSTDRFFRGGIEQGEIANYEAFDQRAEEKGKGGTGLTAEEKERLSQDTADYRLFQNKTAVSQFFQTTRKGLNNLFGWGGQKDADGNRVKDNTFGVGSLAVPFIEVPTNLALKTIEYSPANIVKGAVEIGQLLYAAHNGEISAVKQRAAVMDTFRGMTGTGLLVLSTVLAKAGIIRDADDEDDWDVAALNSSEGRKGTQFNLSALFRSIFGGTTDWQDGDMLFGVSGIAPFDMWLNAGVRFAKCDSISEFPAQYFLAAWDSVTDMPMMQALANMQNTIRDMEGSEASDIWETAKDLAVDTAENTVSSFIPQFIKSGARTFDPYYRSTESDTRLGELGNSVAQYIPGLRNTLDPALTPFGTAKEAGSFGERLANNLFLPTPVNRLRQTDTSKNLERLYNETGKASIYPDRRAPSNLNFNGEKYELTADEKANYQTTYGNTWASLADTLFESKLYKNASNEDKVKMLSDVNNFAKDKAKQEFFGSRDIDYAGSDSGTWAKADEAMKAGLSFAEWEAARMKKAELEKSGQKATQKAQDFYQFLDDNGYSQKEKELLREQFGFYSQNRADPKQYDRLTASGFSTSDADRIFDAIASLKPIDGETSVSNAQKAEAISEISGMNDQDKLRALEAYFAPDKNGKRDTIVRRYEAAMDAGISFGAWTEIVLAMARMGNPSGKDEKIAVFDALVPGQGRAIYNIWENPNSEKYSRDAPIPKTKAEKREEFYDDLARFIVELQGA